MRETERKRVTERGKGKVRSRQRDTEIETERETEGGIGSGGEGEVGEERRKDRGRVDQVERRRTSRGVTRHSYYESQQNLVGHHY